MPVLLLDRTATRAVITLNRPEKLNALSHDLFAALNEELTHLENDKALRVLILTGAGETLAAVSVTGTTSQICAEETKKLATLVRQAAARIAASV